MPTQTKRLGFSQKAFVFNKQEKFLTIRRTKTAPSNPLKWDLPGGDVEFGEDPKQAMLREIREEAGYNAKNLVMFDIAGLIYGKTKKEYWITLAYTTEISSGKLTVSWEHDLHKWVTVDEYLKLSIPIKLRKFAKTLKFKKFK